MSRPRDTVAHMLGITVSDGIAGALIGASAVLLAGIVERRALRATARRDQLQHAVTRLTTESLVLMADLGLFGTAVFRKSIWFHIIGVPDARRIQRQSLRVVAEARSDLSLVTRKKPILEAADHLLDAVSNFVSIATAEHTPDERALNGATDAVATSRRALLISADRTRRGRLRRREA